MKLNSDPLQTQVAWRMRAGFSCEALRREMKVTKALTTMIERESNDT
ncbi:hypothetical protein PhaeoP10_03143 [Phaeobacter inhibens]|nr:hypothetical protein PhaeoP10_03143 [Phaeobacter inhibens]